MTDLSLVSHVTDNIGLLHVTVKENLMFLKNLPCGGAGEGDYNISVDGKMARQNQIKNCWPPRYHTMAGLTNFSACAMLKIAL